MKHKYQITGDLGISYADAGAWRSYEADGAGDNLVEFFENLTIGEVDQDGGELDCYGILDAGSEVEKAVIAALGVSEDEAQLALTLVYQRLESEKLLRKL